MSNVPQTQALGADNASGGAQASVRVAGSIIVAQAADGGGILMQVPDGAIVVEACDTHAAPIPFCCRSAACGTCRVQVLEGAEYLEPPERDELDLLQVFNADPRQIRLACQLRLRRVRAHVHLRAVEE